MLLPPLSDDQLSRISDIGTSYRALAGRPLVPGGGDDGAVQRLWTAPFAIVAHGTEADPIFFFGNRCALELFELDFSAFTRLPSRFSAEPLLRDERARLLDRVQRSGIIEDYEGVRISASGRRFRIQNAAVWNLRDGRGQPAGQAAAFSDWRFLPPRT